MSLDLTITVDLVSDTFLNWLIDDQRKPGNEIESNPKGDAFLAAGFQRAGSDRALGASQVDVYTSEDRAFGIYRNAVLVASPILNVPIRNSLSVSVGARLYLNIQDATLAAQVVEAFENFPVGASSAPEIMRGIAAGVSEDMYAVVAYYAVKVIKLGIPMFEPRQLLDDLLHGTLGGGIGGTLAEDDHGGAWDEKTQQDGLLAKQLSATKRSRPEPIRTDKLRQVNRNDMNDPRRSLSPEAMIQTIAEDVGRKMDCNHLESKPFKMGTIMEYPQYKVDVTWHDRRIGCAIISVPEFTASERKAQYIAYAYLYYPTNLDQYVVDQMMDCLKLAAATFVVVLVYVDFVSALASLKGAFALCVKVKGIKAIDDVQRCISPEIATVWETTDWGPVTTAGGLL
ncbi:hypothetical protein [Mesorhizobium sp. LSHC412B00]|uniref:hypothetical protein n=1 Tax=Mesorhizobium sp. LSHC412B00 TaxID=1287285 RepID=UPI0012EB2F6D|nr:hypothetical protein [Mesorhizobium sp. LSHC412B00]